MTATCPACHMPASSLLALQATAEVRGVAKQATRDAETARQRIHSLNPTADPTETLNDRQNGEMQ